jgi:pimeloyl-ACP methyl ester carboxylesterase
MSPYTSIKKLVKDIVGFLSFVVAERFKNYEKILAVKSPILFIHGEKDTLIRPKHSQEMHNSCKINN